MALDREKAIRTPRFKLIARRLPILFVFFAVFVTVLTSISLSFSFASAASYNFNAITSMIYSLIPLFIALAIIGFIAGLAGHKAGKW